MSDPVTVAREVLMRDAEADAIDDRVGYDASSSLYVENGWSAPTLARAVIDLTAELDAERFAHANTAVKVKRVEALADRLDREASEVLGRPVYSQAGERIRRALNGGDQ